jgi:ankyrin repeat protein
MAAANPASLTTANSQGFLPLHIACEFGHVDIVKYIVEANEEFLKVKTSRGELPFHLACLGGNCNVVNYNILTKSDYGVSLRINGELPFDLLLSDYANCDNDSLEFVEAVGRLVRANPAVVADLH